ncbi:TPA: hypothetical protein L3689_001736 [Pseudomonas aeruginosa]|nr:hypothetical protein [Pseudomonas aeruginosa]
MAFLFASGDPRGEPKLTLEQDEFGKWEWRVWCPLGARPERQAQAYALAERLNSPTGRLRKHRHESLPPRTEEFMRGIVKEVVMSEVKRYIIGRNGLPEFHDSGEYVATSDYDALAAKLTMAEDAAAKGDAARQQCGGMEMEIEELRAELAELRARVAVVPDASTVYAALDARERLFTSPENIQVALEAQSRLNGMTVSEELLRRLGQVISWQCFGDCRAFSDQRIPEPSEVIEELRALLNEDKENGNG